MDPESQNPPATASASASASAGTAPKSRRPHRKSRDGCAECKRRHIRCDKGRPACTNCTIAERACAYPVAPSSAAAKKAAAASKVTTRSPPVSSPNGHLVAGGGGEADSRPPPLLVTPKLEEPMTPAPSASPSEASRPAFPRLPFHLGAFPDQAAATASSPGGAGLSSSSSTSTPHSQNQQPHQHQQHQQTQHHSPRPPLHPSTFSAKDLVLLHHASSSMPDAILGRGQTIYIIDIALRYAVESPYLIHQVLAFAALNLSHLQIDTAVKESLRHQATELQTRALSDFKTETDYLTGLSSRHHHQSDQQQQEDDAYHGVPRFLFAAIIGLHVFADTLLHHPLFPPSPNLPSFVASFIDCLQLHRGVRTVLKPTWEGLQQTELGPLFSALNHATSTRRKGTECDSLLQFMAKAGSMDLDDKAREACTEAVEHLQWGFDLQARLSEAEGPHAASSVCIMFPGELVDALQQLQPLALVILAYFGVLIHRSRRCWIFGDSGRFIIRAVAVHVGSAWEEPLRWPLQQLEKN
ncbi:fungal zn(2)-Cys(6) binuclear cluster domain-containing protein [Sarocladium implicatum]|nr:fungal zn(2)-Cys(6) binuclear cluster domain-containing protein [Sarocladium implicatum]